jgi:hypothetical protein
MSIQEDTHALGTKESYGGHIRFFHEYVDGQTSREEVRFSVLHGGTLVETHLAPVRERHPEFYNAEGRFMLRALTTDEFMNHLSWRHAWQHSRKDYVVGRDGPGMAKKSIGLVRSAIYSLYIKQEVPRSV